MSTLGASTGGANGPTADAVLSYERSDDEEMATALVSAFADPAVDVDLADRETLHEWLSLEAVEDLLASGHDDLGISAVVWDHDVVITAESIEVYERPTPVA